MQKIRTNDNPGVIQMSSELAFNEAYHPHRSETAMDRTTLVVPIHDARGKQIASAVLKRNRCTFSPGFRTHETVFNLYHLINRGNCRQLFITANLRDCLRLQASGVEYVVCIFSETLSRVQEKMLFQTLSPHQIIFLSRKGHSCSQRRNCTIASLASRAYVRILDIP